jgi:hypothetical protein
LLLHKRLRVRFVELGIIEQFEISQQSTAKVDVSTPGPGQTLNLSSWIPEGSERNVSISIPNLILSEGQVTILGGDGTRDPISCVVEGRVLVTNNAEVKVHNSTLFFGGPFVIDPSASAIIHGSTLQCKTETCNGISISGQLVSTGRSTIESPATVSQGGSVEVQGGTYLELKNRFEVLSGAHVSVYPLATLTVSNMYDTRYSWAENGYFGNTHCAGSCIVQGVLFSTVVLHHGGYLGPGSDGSDMLIAGNLTIPEHTSRSRRRMGTVVQGNFSIPPSIAIELRSPKKSNTLHVNGWIELGSKLLIKLLFEPSLTEKSVRLWISYHPTYFFFISPKGIVGSTPQIKLAKFSNIAKVKWEPPVFMFGDESADDENDDAFISSKPVAGRKNQFVAGVSLVEFKCPAGQQYYDVNPYNRLNQTCDTCPEDMAGLDGICSRCASGTIPNPDRTVCVDKPVDHPKWLVEILIPVLAIILPLSGISFSRYACLKKKKTKSKETERQAEKLQQENRVLIDDLKQELDEKVIKFQEAEGQLEKVKQQLGDKQADHSQLQQQMEEIQNSIDRAQYGQHVERNTCSIM